jgi:two-component system sensor histidine kinase RpfC
MNTLPGKIIHCLSAPVSLLQQRLKKHASIEFEQALLRIAILVIILFYLTIATHHASGDKPLLEAGILLFSVHLAVALLLLISIIVWPSVSRARIIAGIFVDIGSFSIAMIVTGEIGAPWWAGSLWITIGNGFRYGERYLYLSAVLSLLGFGSALLLSDYWSTHMSIATGLLVAMAVLPGYIAVLIRRLKAERQRAEEASRAKSEFLARMSHEIRTPLNGIIGSGELLKGCHLGPEERHYLETIDASSHTLLRLIENILDISKIEAGKLELEQTNFDLHSLINTTIGMFSPEAEQKGLRLTSTIGLDTPFRLIGDPHQLRQVLINMIGNAIKFTERGTVELRCHQIRQTDGLSLIRFEVADTGIGMSDEVQQRIFDNFTQADESTTRRYGGTGLGTSIARQLVELMGGRIGLQSIPGIGSTFWFDIDFPMQAELVDEEEILRVRGCRVLRLCQPPGADTEVSHSLTGWGVPYQDVSSPRGALRALIKNSSQGHPFEVIIFDRLPVDEDARNLLKSLGPELSLPEIKVLIVSHAGAMTPATRWITNPVYTLQEPFDKVLLFNALHASRAAGFEDDGIIDLSDHFTRDQRLQHPLRILVAEDNSINRMVIGRILERAGLSHRLVKDGMEVLDAIEQDHYDLAIVDMEMPRMGGIDAYRTYRFAHPGDDAIPFVMLTANATVDARTRCEEAGIHHFLTKPVSASRLLQMISTVAGKLFTSAPSPNPPAQRPAPPLSGIPVIDLDILGEVIELAPDGNFLQQLLDNLARDSSQLIQEMSEALSSGDISHFRGLIHAIKGSALNLGLCELSSLALESEQLTDAQLALAGNSHIDTLNSALERAQAALADTLKPKRGHSGG